MTAMGEWAFSDHELSAEKPDTSGKICRYNKHKEVNIED